MAFGIDFSICIIAMAALTAIYVVAGGYFATVVNDFIQGIIMLIGIAAVILTILNDNGGFAASLNALAHVQDPAVSSAPGIFTSFFGPDPISLLAVVILTSLGTWGLPQMVQKFYSISSEKVIFKGTVISTIFAVVIAGGCYFIGSFGRLYSDRIEMAADGRVLYDSIVPTMLSNFSALLMGVVVILVFSASISTLSALVMTSASTFTLDFLQGNIFKKMDGKMQLLSIRLLIVVFIVISSVIAIRQYKGGFDFIAQLMGISWGALAGSFLAPFLYGLYWKRVSTASVWCCFLFSTSFMILNVFFRDYFPPLLRSPINAGAFAMVAGLVIVPVVSMLTKAPKKATVESCFSCYEETIRVKVSEDLGEDEGTVK
jgi:Na+/pantothenate symporter